LKPTETPLKSFSQPPVQCTRSSQIMLYLHFFWVTTIDILSIRGRTTPIHACQAASSHPHRYLKPGTTPARVGRPVQHHLSHTMLILTDTLGDTIDIPQIEATSQHHACQAASAQWATLVLEALKLIFRKSWNNPASPCALRLSHKLCLYHRHFWVTIIDIPSK
jgi:hypothetical protein